MTAIDRRADFMGLKRLHLLRHAKSSWDDPGLEDHDRPLAPRGHRAAAAMAGHLAARELRPDLVLCSTARRTRETLDYLIPLLDSLTVRFERSIYVFDAAQLLKRIRLVPEHVDDLLVVGHNPALADLAGALTDSQPEQGREARMLARMREKFPTAAFASIELTVASWANVGRNGGHLVHYQRPKDLA